MDTQKTQGFYTEWYADRRRETVGTVSDIEMGERGGDTDGDRGGIEMVRGRLRDRGREGGKGEREERGGARGDIGEGREKGGEGDERGT